MGPGVISLQNRRGRGGLVAVMSVLSASATAQECSELVRFRPTHQG